MPEQRWTKRRLIEEVHALRAELERLRTGSPQAAGAAGQPPPPDVSNGAGPCECDRTAELSAANARLREDMVVQFALEQALRLQRDVVVQLAAAASLEEALRVWMSLVAHPAGLDAGGIYLLDDHGGLVLVAARGVSEDFRRDQRYLPPNSPPAQAVTQGRTSYFTVSDCPLGDETQERRLLEGLRGGVSIALSDGHLIVGSLVAGSRHADEVTPAWRSLVESTAAVVGSVLGRLAVQDQLAESQQRYRALFDMNPDGIVLACPEIQFANASAVRMFGATVAEELVGRTPAALSPPTQPDGQDSSQLGALYAKRSLAGEFMRFNWTHQRLDGTSFQTEVHTAPVRMAGQAATIGVIRDISDRVRAEQALREAERLRAEMESRRYAGQLAAQVAHEINNPLAGIMQAFRLVKSAVPQRHPDLKYAVAIEKELQRVAGIVRQMYSFLRPPADAEAALNLREVVDETALMLRAEADQHSVRIDAQLAVPETIPGLPGGLVRQVLFNLVRNAMEASPPGSVVRIDGRVDGKQLVLTVSDTGVGISAEASPLVFEPFYTTKSHSQASSLGIGLWVCRGIVQSLRGQLDFDSRTGEGTTFRLVLPLDAL